MGKALLGLRPCNHVCAGTVVFAGFPTGAKAHGARKNTLLNFWAWQQGDPKPQESMENKDAAGEGETDLQTAGRQKLT